MADTRFLFLFLLLTFFPAYSLSAESEQPPRVKVSNVTRAFDNGEHNAFTDLIRWKGRYWLAFRSCAEGHPVSTKGAVIVLSSPDAKVWTEAYRVTVPEHDTRGPHFLAFNEKLFLFVAAISPNDGTAPDLSSMNPKNFGCTSFTEDGETWSDPTPLTGTKEYFIWGAARYGGKAYLSGRRTKRVPKTSGEEGFEMVGETALLESSDGLDWKVTVVYHQERGDETSFLFEPNGDLVGVTRRGGPYTARLLRAKPPYEDWLHKDFPFFIGGPLLKKWGDRYIVGGRRNFKEGKKTGLWWLHGDELKSLAILPSGGDNSYPGFAAADDEHGIVCWYSSHEKGEDGEVITAIYTAELETIRPVSETENK